MKLPIAVVDAFTNEAFKGNSAAVVPLPDGWLSDALMQSIAVENNLSETAYLVTSAEDTFEIRWFSPIKEINFCGHATLASAHVIFGKHQHLLTVKFVTKSVGTLIATKMENGLIEMSFPKYNPQPLEALPSNLLEGLSIKPKEVFKYHQAYFAVYETEEEVKAVIPNLQKLAELGPHDVVVTALGTHYDFVSRYFWPANGGVEDPVTGSIHASLAPLWANRLGKNELIAFQASTRGGVLHCRVEADRVFVAGHAVQYMEGVIDVPNM